MSDIDLSSLVNRAQTGDRIAYDGIVRRFQDMAVGYASALLGDFHLAEGRGAGGLCRCLDRIAALAGTGGLSGVVQADCLYAL